MFIGWRTQHGHINGNDTAFEQGEIHLKRWNVFAIRGKQSNCAHSPKQKASSNKIYILLIWHNHLAERTHHGHFQHFIDAFRQRLEQSSVEAALLCTKTRLPIEYVAQLLRRSSTISCSQFFLSRKYRMPLCPQSWVNWPSARMIPFHDMGFKSVKENWFGWRWNDIIFKRWNLQPIFLLSSIYSSGFLSEEFCRSENRNQTIHFNTDVNQVDNTLNAFIAPYRDSLTEKMNTVVVRSEAELIKGRAGKTCCRLNGHGNFVTDACLQIAKQQAEKTNANARPQHLYVGQCAKIVAKKAMSPWKTCMSWCPLKMRCSYWNSRQTNSNHAQSIGQWLRPIFWSNSNHGWWEWNFGWWKPIEDSRWYYVVSSDYLSFGGDDFAVLTEAAERILQNKSEGRVDSICSAGACQWTNIKTKLWATYSIIHEGNLLFVLPA